MSTPEPSLTTAGCWRPAPSTSTIGWPNRSCGCWPSRSATRALDQLGRGESSLADVAASLGFADQAHLTRTVRDHVGHTPASLRRIGGAAKRLDS
jgi:hypothetical protein